MEVEKLKHRVSELIKTEDIKMNAVELTRRDVKAELDQYEEKITAQRKEQDMWAIE